jgi:hypothetical protein
MPLQKPNVKRPEIPDLPEALECIADDERFMAWKPANGRKIPLDPVTGRFGEWSNPDVLRTWAGAARAAKRFGCEGIGIVARDGLAGIDLDDVVDWCGRHALVEAWALALVDRALDAGAYVEYSVSGNGYHILGLARGASINAGRPFELFRRASKYLTISGDQISTARRLPNIDDLIDDTIEHYRFKIASKHQVHNVGPLDPSHDWRKVLSKYKATVKLYGCVIHPAVNGKRSSLAWKITSTLVELGADDDEIASVMLASKCFQSKHGSSLKAAAAEIRRARARA